MSAVIGANLALRFFLELAALVAVGYWGSRAGEGVTRWLFAAGAVAGVAAVWALFVSPKATIAVGDPLRLAIELAVWLAAGAAPYAAAGARLAIGFVAVAIASGALNHAAA